jgi:type IV secretion system protein VirB2
MKNPQACPFTDIALAGAFALLTGLLPELALAQASPFSTGATSFQTNFLAILTPIAVIAVMALGLAALFGRISWGWAAGGVAGIVLVFGAPQLVTWIRGMFAV